MSINYPSQSLYSISNELKTRKRRASAPELYRADAAPGPTKTSIRNPYVVGDILKLRVRDNICLQSRRFLRAEIIKLILPFTMSAAIIVRIHEPTFDMKGTFFLKFYDRCCDSQCRSRNFEDGATKEHQFLTTHWDREYHRYLWTEKGTANLEKVLNGDLDFKEMPKHDDDEDKEELASEELALWAEMGLHDQCIGTFNTERAVYCRLKNLQRNTIPRVIAEVELPDFYSTQHCSPDISSKIGRTLGLLTEYVDGFNLEDLGRPTERFKEPPAQGEHVQIITDRVLDIVRTIMSRGLLNCDSRLSNTLIRWDPVKKSYRPYVIDFGGCSLREEFSTEEWRSAQRECTEEDEIGVCMKQLMNRHRGGGYVYHQSAFARQLVVEMNEIINEALRRQAQEEEQAKVEARV